MDVKFQISLLSLINLFGISQAVFFSALFIYLRKEGNKAHLILVAFFLAFALVQLNDVMEEIGFFLRHPHYSSIFQLLVFILGPLVYYYVLALTKKDFRFTSSHLLHLIPVIALIILLIPYYSLSAENKLNEIRHNTENDTTSMVIAYIGIIQVVLYLIFSLKAIHNYSRLLKDHFSDVEKLSLNWLLNLIGALVLIWLVWLFDTLHPSLVFKYTGSVLFTGMIYVLGFKGIYQPDIFKNINTVKVSTSRDKELPIPVTRKYEKSSIAADKIESSLERLIFKLKVEKVYRQNELTLAQLAEMVEIPGHHLSQLLNEHLKTNFYDFINSYRVEEVKTELTNHNNARFTILALALNAGFNSKAAFNKAFKKHTGFSPTEYKAENS